MRALRTTRAFEKDTRRASKRGKELDKLWAAVEILVRGERLPQRYRPHKLSGAWADHGECHLESDWLLIWHDADDGALVLVRHGTHADLFE